MTEREIYRDPQRDTALVDLSPYIRLSLPMSLFSKYGPLSADWDKLSDKLEEVYDLLTLGSVENGAISLSAALEAEDRDA
tara:strand:+ start:351 stop:590 length:240 start_codon:yes stop_codon:yes gene_type:complete